MNQNIYVKSIRVEKYTPIGLFQKLGAKAILESASFEKGKSRYSLMLVDEAFRVVQRGDELVKVQGSGWERIEGRGDILDYCEAISAGFDHMDFPFPAGGIGFLSYEFANLCDSVGLDDRKKSDGIGDGVFLFGNAYLVFDHYTDTLHIVGVDYSSTASGMKKVQSLVDLLVERVNDFDFNYLIEKKSNFPATVVEDVAMEDFVKKVEAVKGEIICGNLLQAVVSRKLKVKTELSAFEAYKNLRVANPSPYMFFIDFGEFQLFGSSPEVHLKVEDGKALMRPIAGTRRRGKERSEDLALEKELLADAKEASEHLMLVDLARNDLGRVCVSGSVEVQNFRKIEKYSKVMHIVSETVGMVSPEKSSASLIRATFPAGTVSGAPKIMAMRVLDRLEDQKREFYAGLTGYFDAKRNFDSCITIRSCLKLGDTMILQAGAGVVLDSVPEREYEETNEKLRATALAVGIEL
ncbi:MAG: chorismate-binding protein [Spirochaetales bacterium]|nr:chorismate-binding protein [Spirochaetales bacterium]